MVSTTSLLKRSRHSVLTSLIRSIMHDPETFENPMEYRPERYLKDGKLNPDVLDPDSVVFGFGRRSVNVSYSVMQVYIRLIEEKIPSSICPGRFFSNNSSYLLASCLLAVYDITPAVDDEGNTIELKPEFTSGLMS